MAEVKLLLATWYKWYQYKFWYLQGFESSRSRQFTLNDDIVTVHGALVFTLYSVQLVISHLYCFTGHCLSTVKLNNNQKSLKMILPLSQNIISFDMLF
jgi:hypothetical protein